MDIPTEPKSRLDIKELVRQAEEQDCTDSRSSWVEVTYSRGRKSIIVFVVSWMALTVTFSSTAVLSATIEIALEFGTTRGAVDVANAAAFALMGLTSFFWIPVSQFVGRKMSYDMAAILLMASTISTAYSHSFTVFLLSRLFAAGAGTFLLVAGQAMLVEIFKPEERGLATGCLMVGSLFGPALGPCFGGIVVTFSNWRHIFWIQVGMAGFAVLGSQIFLPSNEPRDEKRGAPSVHKIVSIFSPFPRLAVLRYPNVVLTNIACGFLAWLQYCLLVSPRHLINPRFNLTTPLVSGLFYISPGFGFVIGALLGGKLSDRALVHGIRRHGGKHHPEDRLKAGLWAFWGLIPASTLVYGWTLDFSVGGLEAPIVSSFFCGVGLMAAFAGLNTYCAGK